MINRALILQTWTYLKDKIVFDLSDYRSEINSLSDRISGLRNECSNLEKTIWNLKLEEGTRKSRVDETLNYPLTILEGEKERLEELKQKLERKPNIGMVFSIKNSVDHAIEWINKAKKRNGSDDEPTIDEVD